MNVRQICFYHLCFLDFIEPHSTMYVLMTLKVEVKLSGGQKGLTGAGKVGMEDGCVNGSILSKHYIHV